MMIIMSVQHHQHHHQHKCIKRCIFTRKQSKNAPHPGYNRGPIAAPTCGQKAGWLAGPAMSHYCKRNCTAHAPSRTDDDDHDEHRDDDDDDDDMSVSSSP